MDAISHFAFFVLIEIIWIILYLLLKYRLYLIMCVFKIKIKLLIGFIFIKTINSDMSIYFGYFAFLVADKSLYVTEICATLA